MGAVNLLWGISAGTAVAMVVPNVLAFGYSLPHGLRLIDWIYPWKQNHFAFKQNPTLIRSHILGNGVALLVNMTCRHKNSLRCWRVRIDLMPVV